MSYEIFLWSKVWTWYTLYCIYHQNITVLNNQGCILNLAWLQVSHVPTMWFFTSLFIDSAKKKKKKSSGLDTDAIIGTATIKVSVSYACIIL